ncbi:MAG: tRNA (adenosine(37)-N6)-dimethylallyltransferase MiaA [Bacteroidales bacterium]|nr:tRNA (adenosine(37)-N6)-dimethylallyltransferase MiaA [Bacteroidales bacterium]MCF8457394.1 tRNA (adenosine(37)-N6)-dimethylallyltransferase MiaA [Bacteroidales bacterium]
MNKNYLFVIVGPTGIGKTGLSIRLAKHFETEIISSDSRQFYKELKIGTAAPTPDELNEIPHHLIGNISIFDYYNVHKFEMDCLQILEGLFAKNGFAFLVGGSGLYVDAVCNGIDDIPDVLPEIREQVLQRWEKEGIDSLRFDLKKLDPEHYSRIDLKNPKRIIRAVEVCLSTGKPFSAFHNHIHLKRPFEIVKIGLNTDRQELYEKINRRVDLMMDQGLLDEAKQFYPYKKLNGLKTVGYKELFDFFDGKHNLDTAIELIKRNSRRYAKRQITWFSRDKNIHWFDVKDFERIKNFISEQLSFNSL